MLKHCSKEENDRIYPKEETCLHEWIHIKERDELEWPISYYRCPLCEEETMFLPRGQEEFNPE